MNTSFELKCSAPDAAQSLLSSLSPPSRCTLNTRASSPETYVTQSLQKIGGMGRLFLTPNLNPEPQTLNHLVSALGYCSTGHATEWPALGAGSHPKACANLKQQANVWDSIGIMEKKMETTNYSMTGYIGIMEKKMETTIVYWGYLL